MNYLKLRERLNAFNYGVEEFTFIVDCAIKMQAKKYYRPIFPSDESVQEAIKTAKDDINCMNLQEIRNLCCKYETGCELSFDGAKEDKAFIDRQPEVKEGF